MPGALKKILLVVLALAVVAGVWTSCLRYKSETAERQIEVAVDSRLLRREDFGGGRQNAPQLQMLKEAGCTAVALHPLSLVELEEIGRVALLSTAELSRLQKLGLWGKGENPDDEQKTQEIQEIQEIYRDRESQKRQEWQQPPAGMYIVTAEPKLFEKLRLALETLLEGELFSAVENTSPLASFGNHTLFLPESYVSIVSELPLVWPKEEMISWSEAGFKVIPLFNMPSHLPAARSELYWEALLLQLAGFLKEESIDLGPVTFPAATFNYPSPQGKAGEVFQREGLTLGAVEFTAGSGLKELARSLNYRVLLVHQIFTGELGQLGARRSVERLLRAVQERSVKVLLLYPFPEMDPRGEFSAYKQFVRELRDALEGAGFTLGGAAASSFYSVTPYLQALFAAGIAAAAVLLAGLFLFGARTTVEGEAAFTENLPLKAQRRRSRWERNIKLFFWAASLALLIVAAALPLLNWWPLFSATSYRKAMALLASIVFPLFGVLLFLEPALKKSRRKGYLKALIGGFLSASLLTTAGALVAAGMLGDISFRLKIDYFQGVKISQVAPFLLLGLFILLQKGKGLKRELKDLLELNIKVKHLLILFLAGGALLVYLVRGGNFPVLPVSELELALRRYLEALLVARPRFKEFLIGHPGFFLLAALVPQRIKGAKTLALLLALLGQISIFNTFMHLHRPVSLSLLGTAYGAGLGMLFGLLLYLLADRVLRECSC